MTILDEIEDRMPEDYFYNRVAGNAIKSFILISILLAISWFIYNIIFPIISGGVVTTYLILCVITTVAFVYMFRPEDMISAIAWVGFSLIYSSIMYLIGESIVISMILLGVLLTVGIIISEVSFTGILTYKDLKEWVKSDKLLRESSQNIKESVDDNKEDDKNEFA